MSKTSNLIWLAGALLVTPAQAEFPKEARDWMKTAPQPPRQCQLLAPSFSAQSAGNSPEIQYAHWVEENRANPYFKINGRTDDLRFKCKQHGPIVYDGVEWFAQDIEYLRPDPSRPLIAMNVIRLCALKYVRQTTDQVWVKLVGQNREVGSRGCAPIWREEFEAPLPAGQPSQ